MSVWYLDSSAIVKLVLEEAESDALVAWRRSVGPDDRFATCELAITEVLRAVGRVAPDLHAEALDQLDRLDHLAVDRDLLLAAGRAEPPAVRSLDAVHLAAAASLEGALGGVVTYDERMADAARNAGFVVLVPR